MVYLSVIVLCYRITCWWLCNKRFCNKKGTSFVRAPVSCICHRLERKRENAECGDWCYVPPWLGYGAHLFNPTLIYVLLSRLFVEVINAYNRLAFSKRGYPGSCGCPSSNHLERQEKTDLSCQRRNSVSRPQHQIPSEFPACQPDLWISDLPGPRG